MEHVTSRLSGWAAGWAATTVAITATGGTAGWQQSPEGSLPLGLALGALGLFAGAWLADGSRPSAHPWRAAWPWALGYLVGVTLMLTTATGLGGFFLGMGIMGLTGGAIRALLRGHRWDTVLQGLLWAAGFVCGGSVLLFGGYFLGDGTEALVESLTGSPAAGEVGLFLGLALAGALGGLLAGAVGTQGDELE